MIRAALFATSVTGLAALSITAAAQTLSAQAPSAQAPSAQGQAPPAVRASTREACMSSIMSLCSREARSGDRAATRACLIRNLDKTKPECKSAVQAAARVTRR